MTDICTAALLPTKPSSDDDSEFRHGFGAKASLALAQSAPTVNNDITRLCWIVITLWSSHIYADAVILPYLGYFFIYLALSWIFFFHVFPLV